MPDNWNLEEAASVPVVYCTAYYSLIVRGRLREGERVLIHSGSGGVGQAAIAIALSLGCQVRLFMFLEIYLMIMTIYLCLQKLKTQFGLQLTPNTITLQCRCSPQLAPSRR